MHSEYSLHSEHDCIDQFSGHAQSYGSGGVVDQLRRDGSLPQQASSAFFTANHHPHETRFAPDRAVASGATQYVLFSLA